MAYYETKPGNGGYGLEAYDTRTGRYVKVGLGGGADSEFDLEKEDFFSFDDYLKSLLDDESKSYFDTDDTYRNDIYNMANEIDPEFNVSYFDMYKSAFQKKLRKMEIQERRESGDWADFKFESVEECVENLPYIIDDKFIEEWLDESDKRTLVGEYQATTLVPNHYVNKLAMLMQEKRYSAKKMKKMTRSEYNDIIQNNKGSIFKFSDDRALNTAGFRDKKYIPLFRGLTGLRGKADEVKRSFYEDVTGESVRSFLGGRDCFHGSVIYCSIDSDYSKSYSNTWGTSYSNNPNNTFVEMLIKNENLDVLQYESSWVTGMDNDILYALCDNADKIVDTIKQKMGIDEWDYKDKRNEFIRELKTALSKGNGDAGFCAMCLGYDLLHGESEQLDVLNPGVVYCIVD